MFDERAFQTWPIVVLGAVVFGLLFALTMTLGELVLGGPFEITRGVVLFGLVAAVGYIGVAVFIRGSAGEP